MYCRCFSRVTMSMFSRMLGVGLPLDNRLLLTVLVCNTSCKGANKINMFRVPKKKHFLRGQEIAQNTGVGFFFEWKQQKHYGLWSILCNSSWQTLATSSFQSPSHGHEVRGPLFLQLQNQKYSNRTVTTHWLQLQGGGGNQKKKKHPKNTQQQTTTNFHSCTILASV